MLKGGANTEQFSPALRVGNHSRRAGVRAVQNDGASVGPELLPVEKLAGSRHGLREAAVATSQNMTTPPASTAANRCRRR